MKISPVIIGDATFYTGDCLDILSGIDKESTHCCVTSPPYFSLRDFGHNRQIGLERTTDEYIACLVKVFQEVKRVLRDDGTVWLNLGDTYYNGKGLSSGNNKGNNASKYGLRSVDKSGGLGGNFKQKDLIGIPWRVAFALQADGWYLRQDIIWHKPNPMPESVTDRCTKAHEYIFLLSKSKKYYYDHEAIKEPTITNDDVLRDRDSTRLNNTPGRTRIRGLKRNNYDTRNKRSVWTVTTKPFKGAHFAVFPPDLIEPCVLAGCPKGGIVLDPFGGSGTTALMAAKHNRKAAIIELNQDYIDIAVARYRAATKQRRLCDLS